MIYKDQKKSDACCISASTPRVHANSCSAGGDAGTSSGGHPAEGWVVLRKRGRVHMGRTIEPPTDKQSDGCRYREVWDAYLTLENLFLRLSFSPPSLL